MFLRETNANANSRHQTDTSLQPFPETQEESIFTLNPDIQKDLFKFHLNGEDSFNLFCASPRLFALDKQVISKHQDHPLRKLLSHGALGELLAAEAIWKKNPMLLTCYGTVYHPNRDYTVNPPLDIPIEKSLGRYKYVNCTFWQILLMNEEFEEAEKVGEYMTTEEKHKQFFEIFPDGQLKNHHWNLEEARKLLKTVFDAVMRDAQINQYSIQNNNDPVIKNLDMMSESTKKALHQSQRTRVAGGLTAVSSPKGCHR